MESISECKDVSDSMTEHKIVKHGFKKKAVTVLGERVNLGERGPEMFQQGAVQLLHGQEELKTTTEYFKFRLGNGKQCDK